MPGDYRPEPDLAMTALKKHVHDAKCQDVTYCTLALMGREAVGYPVEVCIEDTTMQVRITWTDGDNRFHRGYLRPTLQAQRVLMLTDSNKSKLVRQMPPEGIALTVEEHQSRPRQVRSEERKRIERERKRELARGRADGTIPPPTPRPPVGRPRATVRGLRGSVAA